MTEDISINNVSELREEIIRLRLIRDEQKEALGARFSSPGATFSTVLSLFPRSESKSKNDIFHQDFIGIISRILLPFTLNKTIFRKSNFLVKALVGIVSQKASYFISGDVISGVFSRIKSLFEKKDERVDYGIPPDSETY